MNILNLEGYLKVPIQKSYTQEKRSINAINSHLNCDGNIPDNRYTIDKYTLGIDEIRNNETSIIEPIDILRFHDTKPFRHQMWNY